ncbi:MAG: polysaccharide biosynthesis protein [Candidatus Marinimicrobia bacterium]|jgi:FlaA1/EpsC-like NDP-sugar epimerase|nr:polysaccharide biosynthesis protein [Candidatus Neomarinimicrobiota bacterium]
MRDVIYNKLSSKSKLMVFLIGDGGIILLSLLTALLLRFDFVIPSHFIVEFYYLIPITLIAKYASFAFFHLYKGMFRYTSLWDITNIVKANALASVMIILGFGFFHGFAGFPRSLFLIDFVLSTIAIASSRISVRVYYSHYVNDSKQDRHNGVDSTKTRLLLIGAGRTGEKIVREILTTPHIGYTIVGFLDDDGRKKGATLHGVKVLGKVSDAGNVNIEFDEFLITAPSATGPEMRAIVEKCKNAGKPYKTVPDLSEIIDDNVTVKMIRDVSYVDLLGREEIQLDSQSITKFMRGKRVLVTGAGGSIGSELVRQCFQFNPAMVILFDNSEYNLFQIQQELATNGQKSFTSCVLGSVRDKNTIDHMLRDYKPHVILHAAAYKHVPLQEDHPWEAINTNVLGTMNLINAAVKHEVQKFVLVSTDKAVHPVNVMGATKRLAEIMVQAANRMGKTSFMAVRFGNVLGSSGSVIPIFEKQIKAGGPVKITHPDMIRYFMSIPEAAQLILQASSMPQGRGKIYVLEMGRPVKIKDMAFDLIRLSGLEPEKDIPIVYTGVRPGEKLYEELAFDGEIFSKTDHGKIMILNNGGSHYEDWTHLQIDIQKLGDLGISFDSARIKQSLMKIIPEYKPVDVGFIDQPKIADDHNFTA